MKPTVFLDHVSLPVKDFDRARKLYEAAFGAIGVKVNMEVEDAVGMGSAGEKVFWLSASRKATGGAHHAFRVQHRTDVHAFYDAAIAAGWKDHGKPGPRPDYGPTYYAAFVKDAEGNNIEVVCYAREAAPKKKARTKEAATKKAAAKRARR